MAKREIFLPDGRLYKIIKDTYRKSRGGISLLLDISCATDETKIIWYQKDGPGQLLRCYLDRIVWPVGYVGLQYKEQDHIPNLICPHCQSLLGTVMIYDRENRPAYRMIPGTYRRRIIR